jgi:hypothetical protein
MAANRGRSSGGRRVSVSFFSSLKCKDCLTPLTLCAADSQESPSLAALDTTATTTTTNRTANSTGTFDSAAPNPSASLPMRATSSPSNLIPDSQSASLPSYQLPQQQLQQEPAQKSTTSKKSTSGSSAAKRSKAGSASGDSEPQLAPGPKQAPGFMATGLKDPEDTKRVKALADLLSIPVVSEIERGCERV